jgi:radical SAM superfamily enzyme YgiQ (UPF0313 family)
MPLTLPTLTALVPKELAATVTCIDEGITDVDLNVQADLIGMTVITGTAPRSYELAAFFRRRNIPVVLGGPHVTLAPDDAQPHADSIVVGYAEEEWPRLLRDFAAGCMQPRYRQSPALKLTGYPLPDRTVLPRWRYATSSVFEATRGCIHNCSFCVVPAAWGRTPFQKPIEAIVEDIKRQRARRAIFIDLNLIADKEYAAQLFEALIPLKIEWYGLATTMLCDDLPLLELVARSGCRGLLMGLESISKQNLRKNSKSFNDPEKYAQVVERLHRRRIALQGCFVFGLDEDTPEIFLKTARFAVDARIDLPRFAIVTPFPGTDLYRRLDAEGRILTRDWQRYDGQHVVFQPAQKLSEAHVREVLDHVFAAHHIAPRFSMLVPMTDLRCYRLYLQEADRQSTPALLDSLAESIELGLEKNPYYRHAIQMRQLSELEIVPLAASGESAWAVYERVCLACGQRLGDIKPAILHDWSGWPEAFKKLFEHRRTKPANSFSVTA